MAVGGGSHKAMKRPHNHAVPCLGDALYDHLVRDHGEDALDVLATAYVDVLASHDYHHEVGGRTPSESADWRVEALKCRRIIKSLPDCLTPAAVREVHMHLSVGLGDDEAAAEYAELVWTPETASKWACTRDHRTTPCGDCDGCRWAAQRDSVGQDGACRYCGDSGIIGSESNPGRRYCPACNHPGNGSSDSEVSDSQPTAEPEAKGPDIP